MSTSENATKFELPSDEVNNSENETTENPVKKSGAPDGGWGWVVMIAALIVRVIMAGVYSSFALFTKDFVNEFKMSPSVMGWMIAIYSAVALLVSPLASFLAVKFGFRIVSIAGLAVAGLTYPATYFIPTLWFTFLTASVIVPFAQGITNMCGNLILAAYFDKRLSIAMGVFSCASGVAAFAITPLMTVIINTFGWKLSKVIYSLFYIIAVLCSLTFRPVNSSKGSDKEEKPKEENNIITEEASQIPKAPDSNIYSFLSMANIASRMSINEQSKTFVTSLQNFGKDNSNSCKSAINLTHMPVSTLLGLSIASNLNIKEAIDKTPVNNLEIVIPKNSPIEAKASKSKGYLGLFKNPIFVIVLLSNFLSNLGYDTPSIYTKTKALELGVTEAQATFLLTLIGLGNIIGRLGFGFLGANKKVKSYLLTTFCLLIAGGFILLSRVAFTYPLMIMYVLGYSIFIGGYVTLAPILLVKILDIEDFSNGLSVLFVVQAIGLLFGAPISGLIYDATKSFNLPFISCGSMIFGSGLILAISYLFKSFRESQNE